MGTEGSIRYYSVKPYSGYRHKIHNEQDIRDEGEDGLIRFLEGGLA